jgi:hypothetical protein
VSTMTPVDPASRLMREWEKYQATDDFANTKRWATHEEHTQGSLWAAFMAGFHAAGVTIDELTAVTPMPTPRTPVAMSADELEAIRARAEAATPGPWRTGENVRSAVFVGDPASPRHIATCGPASVGTPADAAFIAHARTDIPLLLAHLDAVRRERVAEGHASVCAVCYHHALISVADIDWLLRQMDYTSDPDRLRHIAFALSQGVRDTRPATGGG